MIKKSHSTLSACILPLPLFPSSPPPHPSSHTHLTPRKHPYLPCNVLSNGVHQSFARPLPATAISHTVIYTDQTLRLCFMWKVPHAMILRDGARVRTHYNITQVYLYVCDNKIKKKKKIKKADRKDIYLKDQRDISSPPV